MMLDLVREWGGKKEATLLACGDRVPAANAVLVMGIQARSNDFEPAGGPEIEGRKCPGHYSATTVPTALVMTEKLGLSGKDLLTALILGDDLATRIGAAGHISMSLGWDPSALCSRFGAAAIAGKLMGLKEIQMLNALGIALNQISGTMQSTNDFTHCFKISQGLAGWNGILSAELAKRGFTGPQPVESPFGYNNLFCQGSTPEIMTKGLGKEFYADEEFKVYPSCRGTSGSTESALKIVKANAINPENIAEINIDLSPSMKGSILIQPFRIGLYTQDSAIMNIQYNVACALLRKSVTLEHFTDKAILDPAILELTRKIKFNLTLEGKRWSARVKVNMKDGKEFSGFTDVPHGDWKASPLTLDEIKGKFRANAAFSKVISLEKAEKALKMLEKIEELDNLALLIKTLTP